MKIIPVQPVADQPSVAPDPDRSTTSRRTFGRKFPSRRTFGRFSPSRRTFGRFTPSRRTFSNRGL
jgi:hypothetical protein